MFNQNIVPTSTDVEPTSNEGIAHIVNFINGSDSITVHLIFIWYIIHYIILLLN